MAFGQIALHFIHDALLSLWTGELIFFAPFLYVSYFDLSKNFFAVIAILLAGLLAHSINLDVHSTFLRSIPSYFFAYLLII